MQEVRCDLRWKAACGLGLCDTGFDPSLLAYFRRRLSRSADPQRIFTAVRAVVAETGILKGKVHRALDSTVLDDAVATQDTVTQIVAAIRRVAREVPGAADLVTAVCAAHDYADSGKPAIAWNDAQARANLVDALVSDAIRLLAARRRGLDRGSLPEREHGPKAADALGLLALVAGQDVEPAEDSDGRDGRWRLTRGTAENRVISIVDPESRHVHKTRTHRQDGYKAHLAIEPETGSTPPSRSAPAPGPATTRPPSPSTCSMKTNRPPAWICSATPRTAAAGPAPPCSSADTACSSSSPRFKTAVPGGFGLDDFAIDTTTGRVTCPARHTVILGPTSGINQRRRAVFDQCPACPLRERCTTAKAGRVLTIRPHHDQQAQARRQAATDPAWQAAYRRWRPPVERAVAWLVAGGNRRLRYRGALANNTWIHTRAASLNLRTLINLGLTRTEGRWQLPTPA